MSELQLKDITKKYIRENFNLNEFRKSRPMRFFKSDLDLNQIELDDDGFVSVEKFIKFISVSAKEYNSTHIKMIEYYDRLELELYSDDSMLESNDEVILRLQKEQKDIIRLRLSEDKQRAEYDRLKEIYES